MFAQTFTKLQLALVISCSSLSCRSTQSAQSETLDSRDQANPQLSCVCQSDDNQNYHLVRYDYKGHELLQARLSNAALPLQECVAAKFKLCTAAF